MPVRVTDDEVKAIIEVDDDNLADATMGPFIEAANFFVDKCCLESDYPESQLILIEKWLAAHFYAIRDPRLTVSQVSDLRDQFESKVDLGFKITRYGQQAMRFDTDGNLAAMDNAMNSVKKALPGGDVTPSLTFLGRRNNQ